MDHYCTPCPFTTEHGARHVDDTRVAAAEILARHLNRAADDFETTGVLMADCINTPLGVMFSLCDARSLHLLEFNDRRALGTEIRAMERAAKGQIGIGSTAATERLRHELAQYFAGTRARFDIGLTLHGKGFTVSVWRALCDIEAGQTRTYGALAAHLGRADAVRAVARANGANQIAILVPCHRILAADGALTGYGGGLWRKQALIDLERQYRHQLSSGHGRKHHDTSSRDI